MKRIYLEFVRGAAAVTVLIYHCIEMHPTTGAKHYYFSNWGTDAVIIFFILSGVVINMSQTNNPKSKKAFLANRLIRLYPQFIIGLVLGLLALSITKTHLPPAKAIIGNFFMLSTLKEHMGYITSCIQSNSPIWSLSFEMLFYVLFAFVIGRHQKTTIFIWLVVSLAVLPLYYFKTEPNVVGHIVAVLAFSSIWLIGYYIYEYRNYFYTDKYTALFSAGTLPIISRMHLSAHYYDPVKYLLFAAAAIPFFRYCLQTPPKGKKINLYYLVIPYLVIVYTVFNQPYITFTNFVLYASLPVGLMTTCFMIDIINLKRSFLKFISKAGKLLGKYSYSIYISHYPVLFICAFFFHSSIPYLIVSLPVIFTIAYYLESWLQPTVVNYFNKYKAADIVIPGEMAPQQLTQSTN